MGRLPWPCCTALALSISTLAAAADRPRTAVFAIGDCSHQELQTTARRLERKLAGHDAFNVVSEEDLLQRIGRKSSKSAADLQRQIDSARQRFYQSSHRQALSDLQSTVEEIARLDPGQQRWQLEVNARLLEGLIRTQMRGKAGSDDAFARVLRLEPTYKLDRDHFTPSTIKGFEKLRRKLARARRGTLEITSSPSDADVFLDGRAVGKTPYRGTLVEGSYLLVVGKSGATSIQRDIRIPAQGPLQIDLPLESSLAGTTSLCFADTPNESASAANAATLGSMLHLDHVVLLRLQRPRPDKGALAATLVTSSGARAVRSGSLALDRNVASEAGLADLARFVTTGEAAPSVTSATPSEPVATIAGTTGAPQSRLAAASGQTHATQAVHSGPSGIRPVPDLSDPRAPASTPATPASAAPADGSHWRADVTYALSGRNALTQQGAIYALQGFAPSYLRLDGAWYRGWQPPGLVADLRIEWFRVSGGTLGGIQVLNSLLVPYSASVGAAADWLPLSWLRLEGSLGYGAAGMPAMVYSPLNKTVEGALLTYHGPVLTAGATATVKAPHFVEIRANALPLSLGGSLAGLPARARHVSLSARGGVAALRFAGLRFTGVLEYELHRASDYSLEGSDSVSQTSHRVGFGVRVTSLEETPSLVRPPAGPGRIRGRVLAQGTPDSIAGAEVVVGNRPPIRTDRSGYFVIPAVDPGPVSIEVRVAGYRTARETVEIRPGAEIHHSLELVRKKGPGSIKGKVLSREDDKPGPAIAGAEVRAQSGPAVMTSEDGSFVLPDVGPGPVTLVVNARNHQAGEEVVSVPPEGEAEVQLLLAKAAAKSQASIRGQVRSAKGGAPVKATLQIREAKVNARADRDGRFTVRVPGGRYTIVFAARGYIPQTKIVDLADGDQALFYIDLNPGDE